MSVEKSQKHNTEWKKYKLLKDSIYNHTNIKLIKKVLTFLMNANIRTWMRMQHTSFRTVHACGGEGNEDGRVHRTLEVSPEC